MNRTATNSGGIEVEALEFAPWRARALTRADAGTILDLLNDPAVAAVRPTRPPPDPAAAEAWIDGTIADHRHLSWIVERIRDQRPSGLITIQDFDPAKQSAEVGYSVCAWARGQGLATAALIAVTDWMFRTLGLHRLSLLHGTDNPASCKVARAAGYVQEGILRDACVRQDGTRTDYELHAILRPDHEVSSLYGERRAGDGP